MTKKKGLLGDAGGGGGSESFDGGTDLCPCSSRTAQYVRHSAFWNDLTSCNIMLLLPILLVVSGGCVDL